MLSGVAHKGAKAKARASGEAISQAFLKVKALFGGANKAPHVSGEDISQACYKAKLLSGGTKIDSSSEANASNAFSEVNSQAYYKNKALFNSAKKLHLAKLN